MKIAYVFPGQGSQHVGMGEGYFERFPDVVGIADDILGYSIEDLCLRDPNKILNQTEYTQPALYTVNALSYAAKLQDTGARPSAVAGHSLGEFNALLAAGAYDFETGLRLVMRRGKLMSLASSGGMIAVLGTDLALVQQVLERFDGIEIANVNSPQQIVISGDAKSLGPCSIELEQLGAKCVQLKVSSAFHSSFMRGARASFEEYIREVRFNELTIPVVSNLTAQYYPVTDYQHLVVDQITGSVRWHESVLLLLKDGGERIEEVGPGNVLTNLTRVIEASWRSQTGPGGTVKPVTSQLAPKKRLMFMYGGQGFHYSNMGRELFDNCRVFRDSMSACDEIVAEHLGLSIIDGLYLLDVDQSDMENILLTHPACFSVGYSLTRELESRGMQAEAVFGYSLGEYIAATVAGALTLSEALGVVCAQARLLHDRASSGRMLTVLTGVEDYSANPDEYLGVHIACVNYDNNFVVSGENQRIAEVSISLSKRGVLSCALPVSHSFHTHHLDAIREEFAQIAQRTDVRPSKMKFFSASTRGDGFCQEDLWRAIRDPVHFPKALAHAKLDGFDYVYVDLSPTGSLAAFMDRVFGKRDTHTFAINQFGNNLDTVKNLVAHADLA